MVSLIFLSNDPNYKWEFPLGEYPSTKQVSDTGPTFVSINDSAYLAPFLNEARLLTLQMLIAVLGFGLVTVGFFSYVQYLPIKKLHSSLEDETPQAGNELEQIHKKVTDMAKRSKTLQQLDNAQNILDLIENTNIEAMAFTEGLQNRGKGFSIALFKHEQLSSEAAAQIKSLFPLQLPEAEAYLFHIPLQKKSGILLLQTDASCDAPSAMAKLKEELGFHDALTFYYGSGYEKLNKIHHSYIEALIACDYLTAPSESLVAYQAEEPLHGTFFEYPKDLETKLLLSIRQGTQDVALHNLAELFRFLKKNRQYEEEIRLYCYYIIKILIVTATELDVPKELFNLKRIMEFQVLEELEKSLVALTEAVIAAVHEKRGASRHLMYEETLATIEAEFRSPDLTLEYLAEKYDYSVSYISKMIKEELGMTFTKYVQQLRMDHIKEALIDTELPIKDIIQGAGYYDVSNFTRTFKKKLGVTPGQFRELNGKGG